MKNFLAMAVCAAGALAACADGATYRKEKITLPTYVPGGYEKTPLFYTGRVYQGAQGRIYPYPAQDVLHDDKRPEDYLYLTLENDWLQMGVLPEHGGHLLNLTDKQTGYEAFYRQHVIKPALIGMLGAWISGGVEWNFPHHHRPTSSMPIDWRHEKRRDGTETIWLGETELTARLKWTIGLSLLKDRAVLRAENIFMNRGPQIESMLYWANVAVHCGDDYQVIFPPACHLGYDHHKASWTSFPIGSVGASGRPGEKERMDSDLSWWKNFVHRSRSIFAWDPDNDWLAGYDHGKNAGTVHTSNRHVTIGKKFFLWGNFPAGKLWDSKVLTDTDGPYLELMVGCWSDNQPDYSWIAPYETRRVSQFWYPVKGIGGVKNATLDGAVNVERQAKDKLLVGFHSTRELKGCTVKVSCGDNGGRVALPRDRGGRAGARPSHVVFTEGNIAIGPNAPWCKTVKVDAAAKDQQFTAVLADADGKVFLSYTPVPEDPHDPLPEKVANPQQPEKITSAEVAYLTGLRLDQFKNGLIDPMPYYRRACEIDPSHSAANLQLGYHAMRELRWADAEKYFRAAADRVNRNYTRAKDVEPEYMLALACREQGKCKEAEDLLWRVTWRATHAREAYVELARLACLRGAWEEADTLIDEALERGAREAKLHVIKAFILRRAGGSQLVATEKSGRNKLRPSRMAMAKRELALAVACDPLENWGVAERGFLKGMPPEKIVLDELKDRGLRAAQLMETVCDYAGLGAWDEVVALCEAAEALAAREKPVACGAGDRLGVREAVAACASLRSPMFAYMRGRALQQTGRSDEARKAWQKAAAEPGDYCFPSRPEEYAALAAAATCGADAQQRVPPAANTHYYLGEILWFRDRKDDAIAAWRACVAQKGDHALALRCLGFALSHPGTYFTNTGVPSGVASEEAYGFYLRAMESDPGNAHVLLEVDELAQKLKVSAAKRLAYLEARRAVVEKYDPVLLRLAGLYNETRQFDKALAILTSRTFHVWEGGRSLLSYFTDATLGCGLAARARGDNEGAAAFFRRALEYPENLQCAPGADAGVAPQANLFLAECREALGDAAGARTALEAACAGWNHPGAMNFYRAEALVRLARAEGRAPDAAAVKAELSALDGEIARLEKPFPKELHASRKFFAGTSQQEAERANRCQAKYLRGLKSFHEGRKDEAAKLFGEAVAGNPSLVWAAYWRTRCAR